MLKKRAGIVTGPQATNDLPDSSSKVCDAKKKLLRKVSKAVEDDFEFLTPRGCSERFLATTVIKLRDLAFDELFGALRATVYRRTRNRKKTSKAPIWSSKAERAQFRRGLRIARNGKSAEDLPVRDYVAIAAMLNRHWDMVNGSPDQHHKFGPRRHTHALERRCVADILTRVDDHYHYRGSSRPTTSKYRLRKHLEHFLNAPYEVAGCPLAPRTLSEIISQAYELPRISPMKQEQARRRFDAFCKDGKRFGLPYPWHLRRPPSLRFHPPF